MAGRSEAQSREGWTLAAGLEPANERIRHRRWRILRAVLPQSPGLGPVPAWIATPEHFIGWLVSRLAPAALQDYVEDLEEIAKQTCDLELLRLARKYRRRR